MLFEYIPDFGANQEKFDLYGFFLNVDAANADKDAGLHAQLRVRDTKLRSFFLSNVWFQEIYAWKKLSLNGTHVTDVHAGKVYRKVGILWDDSFFGNVQYFNGLKLNPDYGVEFVGTPSVNDKFVVDYSAQFFPNSDSTNGSLPGRSVVDDPVARLHNTFTLRAVPTWKFNDKDSLGLGLSALSGTVERSISGPGSGPNFNMNQEAADVTLTCGPSISYVELLNQNGEPNDAGHPLSRPGYDTATYILAGTRWQLANWVNARVNWSQANYKGNNSKETEVVPGFVFTLAKNMSMYAEYNYWVLTPRQGPETLIDRSYNLVLVYNF